MVLSTPHIARSAKSKPEVEFSPGSKPWLTLLPLALPSKICTTSGAMPASSRIASSTPRSHCPSRQLAPQPGNAAARSFMSKQAAKNSGPCSSPWSTSAPTSKCTISCTSVLLRSLSDVCCEGSSTMRPVVGCAPPAPPRRCQVESIVMLPSARDKPPEKRSSFAASNARAAQLCRSCASAGTCAFNSWKPSTPAASPHRALGAAVSAISKASPLGLSARSAPRRRPCLPGAPRLGNLFF
mmetsp:Transcript_140652/g.366196  ORF Transcript_140652/g.366196 Transcript_140652/m.366196 type:complete len:240 (-) Transcript_140652:200-919(-)